jgi:hypothetical protein
MESVKPGAFQSHGIGGASAAPANGLRFSQLSAPAALRNGGTGGDKRQCVGRRLRFVALRAGDQVGGGVPRFACPRARAKLATDRRR